MRRATTSMAAVAILTATAPASALLAQAARNPAFEVASIRRNTSGTTSGGSSPSGQVAFNNQTIRDLISRAYEVPFERVEGGPDWLIRDRYDFIAKAPEGTPTAQRTLMLRTFLAERLKLVVRQQPRDMPAFALVMARVDRRLGPQLKPSSVDCDAIRTSRGGGAAPPTPQGERPVCGGMTRPGFFTAGAVTMAEAAERFLRAAGRPVIDRTGLAGRYDFDIKFVPDEIINRPDRSGPIAGPPFAAALEEQLGLRLESISAPVTFIVVESVERPSDN